MNQPCTDDTASTTVLDNVSPYNIETINVSTNPADVQKYTDLNSIGLVEITSNAKNEIDNKPARISFSQSNFSSDAWRYQSTLYWNPNVEIHDNNLIKLKLKINELQTNFKVIVSVKSPNGIAHQQSSTFSTIRK